MGLFEVVRWKRSLTANVCLSCDVNSMEMPACFEGSRMGASGWIYPALKTHLTCRAGTMASGSCSFTFLCTHIHKNRHSLSVSSSLIPLLSLIHPVLYICHIGVPPMQLVPAPIPRSPAEMCSSKHFTLAYAKGKWQQQVCDRQRTVCAQGCHWQTEPFFFLHCFYLLNNGYV